MLSIQDLTFRFPGRTIIDKVSFDVQPGSIVGLVGGNGAGKTTLLNLISGYLRPATGTIRFGEVELTDLLPHQISELGVARTFQDLRLARRLSVGENILLAMAGDPRRSWLAALLRTRKAQDIEAVRDETMLLIAKLFHLNNVVTAMAGQISFGQQKLLTLACAMARMGNVLLLDEPVAGIAPSLRGVVGEHLRAEAKTGKSVLLVEHTGEFLERICDRVYFLHDGRLMAFDNYRLLKQDPTVRASYLAS